jgi:carnitine O-acetyltransferase
LRKLTRSPQIKENSLTFTLTSLKLDASRLRHYINESINELRELHDRLAAGQSKL